MLRFSCAALAPRYLILLVVVCLLQFSCTPDAPDDPDNPPEEEEKPLLKYISSTRLSRGRILVQGVEVGNKALFAGGLVSLVVDDPSFPFPGPGMYFGCVDSIDVYDGQSGSWSTDRLSLARTKMGVISSGNRAWFAGGEPKEFFTNPTCTKVIDIYNVATNTWSSDLLSEEKYNVIAGKWGGKIFFAGGLAYARDEICKTVDIYDTLTNSWEHRRIDRGLITKGAVCGNELFVPRWDTTIVDVYHLENNSFRTIEMGLYRQFLTVVSAGHLVLFAGGSRRGVIEPLNRIDIFDTQTGTWSVDSLSEGRYAATPVVIGNKIVFVGGTNSHYLDGYSKRIDIYDVNTRKWSIDSLTFISPEPAVAVAGNKMIVVSSVELRGGQVDIFEIR